MPFQLHTKAVRKKLFIAVDGLEKCGKSHFALTAPGPIAYINIDKGLEGVVQKFPGKVHVADYVQPHTEMMEAIKANPKGTDAVELAKRLWTTIVADIQSALGSQNYRTLAVDTAGELWETLRVARLGRLSNVMPMQYGPVNAEFTAILHSLLDHPTLNVVLLHHLKAEYISKVIQKASGEEVEVSTPTGRWVREGFKRTKNIAEMNATVDCRLDGFHFIVENSRHNATLRGFDFPEVMCNFPTVACAAIEGSTPADWQ